MKVRQSKQLALQRWLSRFGDPGFVYGVALSQTAGRIMLRMAEADVLPYVTSDFCGLRYPDLKRPLAH